MCSVTSSWDHSGQLLLYVENLLHGGHVNVNQAMQLSTKFLQLYNLAKRSVTS